MNRVTQFDCAEIARTQPGTSPELAERLIVEGLISLVAAAALLPPVKGKRVSTTSIFRWIVKGKSGIKLEAIRLHGSGFWTSRPAMARFASALTARESKA